MVGDETPAIQSVLESDTHREGLLKEEFDSQGHGSKVKVTRSKNIISGG